MNNWIKNNWKHVLSSLAVIIVAANKMIQQGSIDSVDMTLIAGALGLMSTTNGTSK